MQWRRWVIEVVNGDLGKFTQVPEFQILGTFSVVEITSYLMFLLKFMKAFHSRLTEAGGVDGPCKDGCETPPCPE